MSLMKKSTVSNTHQYFFHKKWCLYILISKTNKNKLCILSFCYLYKKKKNI